MSQYDTMAMNKEAFSEEAIRKAFVTFDLDGNGYIHQRHLDERSTIQQSAVCRTITNRKQRFMSISFRS